MGVLLSLVAMGSVMVCCVCVVCVGKAVVFGWRRRCVSVGVSLCGITGMFGHVVVKHLGCHDSPWLWSDWIRHSRPTRSWLQMGHVALLRGKRSGCIVMYVRLGRTMLRLLFLTVVGPWVGGLVLVGGPGWDASPIRWPLRPYFALRGSDDGSGVGWRVWGL